MDASEYRTRAQLTRDHAWRTEDRLTMVENTADSHRAQLSRWRETARLRAAYGARATRRGQRTLATRWAALEQNADAEVRQEQDRLNALERQLHLLELTARAAWSEHEAARCQLEEADAQMPFRPRHLTAPEAALSPLTSGDELG